MIKLLIIKFIQKMIKIKIMRCQLIMVKKRKKLNQNKQTIKSELNQSKNKNDYKNIGKKEEKINENQNPNNIKEENGKKEILKHKSNKTFKENNIEKFNKVYTTKDNEENYISEQNQKNNNNNNNILSSKSSIDKPKINANKNKKQNNSIINQKENKKRKEKKESDVKKLLLHIMNLRDIKECLYKWIYVKESLESIDENEEEMIENKKISYLKNMILKYGKDKIKHYFNIWKKKIYNQMN